MNRQPYAKPPRSWPPMMWPTYVRCWAPFRRRSLRRGQRLDRIDLEGLEHLAAAAERGGVLITPNHSAHYDSFCLYEAADRIGRPFAILTAWQVFAMSKRLEVWSMQRHGCFSIDRESNDLTAFKTSVEILQAGKYPLVVFPEGDIYHTTDRVTPFREGAAAMALAAAKRAERPICALPCAVKFRYTTDPTPELVELMDRLERRMLWTPRRELPLVERIYRFAEGLLCLQELEFLGAAQIGDVPTRIRNLIAAVLDRADARWPAPTTGSAPERVKELRRRLIERKCQDALSADEAAALDGDMSRLFLAMQLYSYPGDYVRENPTIERIAETLDKFEEDVLEAEYPAVRGRRRVTVKFGEPVPVVRDRTQRDQAVELARTLERRVQGLLDEMNGAGST